MTALWSNITNERGLLSLCHAHLLSSAVFAGLEIGLFEHLNRCKKAPVLEVAKSLELPGGNLKRLVLLLHAMGLIEQTGDEISNAPLAAKFLVTNSSENFVSVLLHQSKSVYPLCSQLAQALQESPTGKQGAHDSIYDDGDEREKAIFLEASNFYSRGVGTALAEACDFTSVKNVVDLGAGGGQVAQEMMEALPHISMTLIDRAATLAFLSSRVELQRFASRFTCVAGDFFHPLHMKQGEADVVVLSSVLGDWDKEDRFRVLANAHSLLKLGGTLLISETLVDEDALGPLRAGVISLYVLLLTKGGNNYPASFWREELAENGFIVERVCRNADKGMRDTIVARKQRR